MVVDYFVVANFQLGAAAVEVVAVVEAVASTHDSQHRPRDIRNGSSESAADLLTWYFLACDGDVGAHTAFSHRHLPTIGATDNDNDGSDFLMASLPFLAVA